MQRETRGMQDYIRNLYVSASTLDIVAYITLIILVASFFEKIFNVNFIGRRIVGGIWSIVKFIFRRIFSIFTPEIEKVKPGLELLKKFATNSSEVEEQLASLLTVKTGNAEHISAINEKLGTIVENNSRQDEALISIGEKIHDIDSQLRPNGGESIKDAVEHIKEMLGDSVKDRASIRAHLEIEDKLSDRMMFKLDSDAKCIFISNAFLKYFGWTESDMIGDTWTFCIADRDLGIVQVKWEIAFKNKVRYYNKQHIKDAVGVEHYCLVVAYPILVDHELLGFRGVVEVIDENDEKINLPPLKIHDTNS